ncbi:MAG: hypothetical protein JJT76_03065 [Clostridiaceae bacterium]|nr:hypothetical protein [Clostridiaceae bacterium]
MFDKFEVDNFIEKLAAISMVKSFYPTAVAQPLGESISHVVKRLNELVKDDKLIRKYEIRDLDSLEIITIVNDYKDVVDKLIYSEEHGSEIMITMANVYPIYYFNDMYRINIKKKRQLKH